MAEETQTSSLGDVSVFMMDLDFFMWVHPVQCRFKKEARSSGFNLQAECWCSVCRAEETVPECIMSESDSTHASLKCVGGARTTGSSSFITEQYTCSSASGLLCF